MNRKNMLAPATGNSHAVYARFTEVAGDKSDIFSQVNSGAMPQGSSLSADQKKAILCWINNGAPNN